MFNLSLPIQALPPNNNLFRFYILLAIILVLGIITNKCSWSCNKQVEYVPISAEITPVKPKTVNHKSAAGLKDTVKIAVKNRLNPTRIDIFKPDTTRRKLLEKDTIVSGIVLKNGTVNIQTLTPTGIQVTRQFDTPPLQFTKVEVDAAGNLAISVDSSAIKKEERKIRWRKFKQGVLITAVAVLAYTVGRSMQGSGD